MSNRQEFLERCYTADFETSGLDVDVAEIVEQGVSAFTHDTWVNFCSTLYDCSVEIPPEASAVSNITSEMVAGLPYFTYDAFAMGVVDPDNSILVSHNSAYDSGVFEKYVTSASTYDALSENWLCTLRMIRKLHANDADFTGFNLSYLRYKLKLNVECETDAHRAGYDSYVTGLVLNYILDELESRELIDVNEPYLDQIKEWTLQPILIELMPFGKHQGEKIGDVPSSYLEWGLDKMDKLNPDSPEFDSDLAATVLSVLESRE